MDKENIKIENTEEIIEKSLSEEEFNDDESDIHFDLSVTPSDPTLELLNIKIDNGELIVPFYQRRYVWTIEQASKLVESFLLGLPVPQVFFYINEDNDLEIIDGQQRILSIKYFFDGFFGEEDGNERKVSFRLRGLSENSIYNRKTFKELDKKDQRKLKNSTLRAVNIKQLKPNNNNDCVFHIFQRLNTGGTQLKPQEIRNAVYRGDIVPGLMKLNENKDWLNILGFKKPHKNQRDVELILRLLGLYKNWESYERPMKKFLNETMFRNKDFNSDLVDEFKARFEKACNIINGNIEKPFRPKGVLNTALLESVFVALMESLDEFKGDISEVYKDILEDEELNKYINGATADKSMLLGRIGIAKKYF